MDERHCKDTVPFWSLSKTCKTGAQLKVKPSPAPGGSYAKGLHKKSNTVPGQSHRSIRVTKTKAMRALASWAVTLTAPTKKTTRHLAPACCKECILRAHGCRMRRGCCHAHPPGQHQRLSHPQRPRNQGQSLASGNKEQVQPKSVVVHRFPQPVSSACMATTWELDIEYSWPPEGAWRDTLFKDWTSNWQLMARQEKAKKRNHCLWQPQKETAYTCLLAKQTTKGEVLSEQGSRVELQG
eukprot:scaffold228102_cov14-Tisochrysis_lutea.AAC.1